MLSYGVQVQVEVTGDALARLESDIADCFAADGWDVKPSVSSNRVRFQRGSTTIGATIAPEKGLAVVSGSGGCVE
jgi:hypothetical protein